MAKVMNAVFGIGIAVIIFIVVLLGIQAFYPAPTYEKYCNDTQYLTAPAAPTQTFYDCPRNMTVDACIITLGNTEYNATEQKAYNDKMTACSDTYTAANKSYSKIFFIIASILGMIAIIVAFLLLNIMSLSAGIASAGIVLVIIAFVRGWNDTNDIMKFLFGLVIAVVIIYLALKINKRFSDEKEQTTTREKKVKKK